MQRTERRDQACPRLGRAHCRCARPLHGRLLHGCRRHPCGARPVGQVAYVAITTECRTWQRSLHACVCAWARACACACAPCGAWQQLVSTAARTPCFRTTPGQPWLHHPRVDHAPQAHVWLPGSPPPGRQSSWRIYTRTLAGVTHQPRVRRVPHSWADRLLSSAFTTRRLPFPLTLPRRTRNVQVASCLSLLLSRLWRAFTTR
mmetsp:Transcript_31651/g.94323  ORF Transcript_31651/g.94323 Transcript_31651/m.94323 type:complete len:203 (-) Transcript_31651:122-730(-)